MSKLSLATMAAVLSMSSAALAADEAACKAMWDKAGGKDGKMSGDMAKPYMMAMDSMKMPASMAKDGVVMDKEFMAACMKDAFKDMK